MRFVKGSVLIGFLLISVGALLLFMEGKADPVVQPQFGKPAMWGGDTLVHQGSISRYSRNGYSVDYDDDYGVIFAAVTGYSSGPDTCFIYLSINGGADWITSGFFDTTTDLSNPQVVIGEGANPYQFYFLLDQHAGEIILKRMYQTTLNTYIISDGNESFAATRNDPGDNYYLHLAQAKNTGEIIFSYSTNFGVNWQRADTVDGDQPHICTAGPDGQNVFMTWRMDGEKGALCGIKTQEFFTKGLNLGTGEWKGELIPLSPYGGGYDSLYCILQDDDGTLLIGVTDAVEHEGQEAKVFRSTDGGENWTVTGELTGAERVLDLMEHSGTIYAATGQKARVFKSTNQGDSWGNTSDIGGTGDDHAYCLAVNELHHWIYAGTGEEGDVFKTTNWGVSWTELAELSGADKILDIIVTSNGTLLAAGWADGDSTGIFRSADDGTIWQLKRPVGVKWAYSLFEAWDGSIYAGVHTSLSPSQRVLRSTDDGASWDYTNFEESSGRLNCITEDSDGVIYVTNNQSYVKKSTNQGAYWTSIPEWHAEGLNDLIVSTPQIMVKKGSSRGTVWHGARNISAQGGAKSDPKVAATQGTSNYKVWVAYTQEGTYNKYLPCYYSTDQGTTWTQGNYLAENSSDEQQLCDLQVDRGNNSRAHAAYCDNATGNIRLYYTYADASDPGNWYDSVRITGLRPTTLHTPEISFYQGDPLVFYSWNNTIMGSDRPWCLYVNGFQWTGIEDQEDFELQMPSFSLSQNYPNPFNPMTRIQYSVHSKQTPEKAVGGSQFIVHRPIHTTLQIYNIQGELVRTLVDEPKEAGSYRVIWDGKNGNGEGVASGIYFCKLKVEDYSQTKKMILIK